MTVCISLWLTTPDEVVSAHEVICFLVDNGYLVESLGDVRKENDSVVSKGEGAYLLGLMVTIDDGRYVELEEGEEEKEEDPEVLQATLNNLSETIRAHLSAKSLPWYSLILVVGEEPSNWVVPLQGPLTRTRYDHITEAAD